MTASQIEAHGVGVSLSPYPKDSMDYLLTIEKERLIEMHTAEVLDLYDKIGDITYHASELGDEIRQRDQVIKKRDRSINYLYMALVGVALVAGYFALRDLGCGAPSWGRWL